MTGAATQCAMEDLEVAAEPEALDPWWLMFWVAEAEAAVIQERLH